MRCSRCDLGRRRVADAQITRPEVRRIFFDRVLVLRASRSASSLRRRLRGRGSSSGYGRRVDHELDVGPRRVHLVSSPVRAPADDTLAGRTSGKCGRVEFVDHAVLPPGAPRTPKVRVEHDCVRSARHAERVGLGHANELEKGRVRAGGRAGLLEAVASRTEPLNDVRERRHHRLPALVWPLALGALCRVFFDVGYERDELLAD
ncbi:hypothetical protein T492DRAFT_1079905 [Pavlovales sp. CCMP2436]|nr:hypothetical protein T492DRAFT_1079905 [Pavlovales sp. CCMP2436]